MLGANGRQFQPGSGKGPEGLSQVGRESSSGGKDRLGASSLDGGQTELESRMGEKRGGDAAERRSRGSGPELGFFGISTNRNWHPESPA